MEVEGGEAGGRVEGVEVEGAEAGGRVEGVEVEVMGGETASWPASPSSSSSSGGSRASSRTSSSESTTCLSRTSERRFLKRDKTVPAHTRAWSARPFGNRHRVLLPGQNTASFTWPDCAFDTHVTNRSIR